MNHPPRFIVPRRTITGTTVRIGGNELHHMRDVMRLGMGDCISIIDDANTEYRGIIESYAPDYAVIAVEAIETAPLEHRLTLAVALIKGPRMDFIVEKAAELGATEFVPMLCERSVVRDPGTARIERWRRLARAAMKQSLAPVSMTISAPRPVAEMAACVPKESLAIICSREGAPLSAIVREHRPSTITLASGPEGGFDATEIAAMKAQGFREASLGPNRLRSETAALAALSVATAALDDISRSK
jgi:16S rRNA (uracil1498-N3)-methyltransferase